MKDSREGVHPPNTALNQTGVPLRSSPVGSLATKGKSMPRSPVPTKLFQPIGPYNHAVVANGQVFISGTPGVDSSTGLLAGTDAYSQTRQALINIKVMLEAAGASLNDVVHVQVNLINVADFAEMNRAYAELFVEPYPARTVIGIAALPKAGALLTINATAVLARDA